MSVTPCVYISNNNDNSSRVWFCTEVLSGESLESETMQSRFFSNREHTETYLAITFRRDSVNADLHFPQPSSVLVVQCKKKITMSFSVELQHVQPDRDQCDTKMSVNEESL